MKKAGLAAVLAAVMLVSGCNSVSKTEYESTVAEYESGAATYQSNISELEKQIEQRDSQISNLKSQVENLEEANNSLSEEISDYQTKINELENGSSNLLTRVLNAFEREDYDTAVYWANQLHSKYNGSPDDEKAQIVMEQAQAEIDKIEAAAKAEEERKAAEAAKSDEEKIHSIIQVHELVVNEINSAGGVDVKIAWKNCSDKSIKYITFIVEPYNAVGDKVWCEITGDSSKRLRVTGPIDPGHDADYFYDEWLGGMWFGDYWDAVWYNNTVKTLKFTGIEIEYMNGTKENINGEKLDYVIW